MTKLYLKEAKTFYLQNFGYKSSLAALYGFFVILILVGAYFLPISLILTIPFLFMPLTLGFIAGNSSLNAGLKNPIIAMFIFFGKYYKDAMFGCFRSLFGLIKAVVVYFAYSTIISLIVTIVLFNTSPEFVSIVDQIQNSSFESLEKLLVELEAIPEYMLGIYISFTISFGFAAYAFLHHIITNSIKYHFLFSTTHPFPYRETNLIHRYAFRKFRKEFYLNYYSLATFIALLFIGGYAGGSILSYFQFHLDYIQASIVGLFGGFILNLFLLPFLLDVIEITFRHNKPFYASIDFAVSSINAEA